MDRRLRIGLFIDTFFPMIDGVVMVVDNYARRMAATADVTVFAPESRDKSYEDHFPYRVVRCKCLDVGKLDYTLPIPALDFRFVDDLIHEQLDIVHIHSPFTVGRMGLLYAQAHGIPAVATMHSQYRQDFQRTVKLEPLVDLLTHDVVNVFARCDEAWAVNVSVARIFHEDYGYPVLPRVQNNATDLLPVPDRAAAGREIRARYGIPAEVPLFLFVGRLNKLKNILFLADALRVFRDRFGAFHMLFVGDGQDREELLDRLAADGLSDRVTLVPRVADREDLARHYAAASLFLFPSLYDASSLVQIEAASQSLPGIFLRGAATAATVEDGVSGLLSEHTPEAFAARIHDALDPALLPRLSEGAFAHLYRTYDDAVASALARYRELIAVKQPTFLSRLTGK